MVSLATCAALRLGLNSGTCGFSGLGTSESDAGAAGSADTLALEGRAPVLVNQKCFLASEALLLLPPRLFPEIVFLLCQLSTSLYFVSLRGRAPLLLLQDTCLCLCL